MTETNPEMEARLKALEDRFKVLEDRVGERLKVLEERMMRFTESLVGSLDGRPGALTQMQRALEVAERTATSLLQLTVQIDSLKLDRAKVLGGIAAVSVITGLFVKFLLK